MNEIKKGDRVVVKTTIKEFHGVIVGEGRDGRWWSVRKDGTKYPQSFNKSFCRPEQHRLEHEMSQITEDQIKHMVDRFLGWKLPDNFNPDGGISFKKTFNDHLPQPMKNEPVGTNLFDAMQADAMVRYMMEGLLSPQGSEVPHD